MQERQPKAALFTELIVQREFDLEQITVGKGQPPGSCANKIAINGFASPQWIVGAEHKLFSDSPSASAATFALSSWPKSNYWMSGGNRQLKVRSCPQNVNTDRITSECTCGYSRSILIGEIQSLEYWREWRAA